MGHRRDAERAAMMLARGADWAQVAAQTWRPLDQDLIREKAKAAVAREQQRYERRRERLTVQAAVFGGTAGVFAVGEVARMGNHPGSSLWVLVGLVGFGGLSARAIVRRRSLKPPVRGELPPPSLPSTAIGAPEAQRLAHVRAQLSSMLDTVTELHPDAGAELRRADSEAGKAFGPLVERLQVLDKIRREMPGGPAAESATASAQGIAHRLSIGVDSYERLLASAATMLGSPDVAARGITTDLQDAAQALMAYSHGLGVAAPEESATP